VKPEAAAVEDGGGSWRQEQSRRHILKRLLNPDGSTQLVTRYYFDGDRVVEERTGAQNLPTRQYIWGNYVDELLISDQVDALGNLVPANRLYALQNSTYSIHALVNDAGVVVERYDYTPYGEVTFQNGAGTVVFASAVGNVYLFTGRELDAESGLMHFRARTYSPKLGRFVQRDPSGFGDGMNLYEFLAGRPTTRTDPSGRAYFVAIGEGDDYEWRRWYGAQELERLLRDVWPGQPISLRVVSNALAGTRPIIVAADNSSADLLAQIAEAALRTTRLDPEKSGSGIDVNALPRAAKVALAIVSDTYHLESGDPPTPTDPKAGQEQRFLDGFDLRHPQPEDLFRQLPNLDVSWRGFEDALEISRNVQDAYAQAQAYGKNLAGISMAYLTLPLPTKAGIAAQAVILAGLVINGDWEEAVNEVWNTVMIAGAVKAGALVGKLVAHAAIKVGKRVYLFVKTRGNKMAIAVREGGSTRVLGVAKSSEEARAACRRGDICFVAGTQVLTADGTRNIEDVREGDLVLSRNDQTGRRDYKRVVQTFVTRPTRLYHIRHAKAGLAACALAAALGAMTAPANPRDLPAGGESPVGELIGADSPASELVCTGEHPFWNAGAGKWVEAASLRAGDRLTLDDGATAEVVSITVEDAPAGTTFTTYNFEVEDWHTYFVAPKNSPPGTRGVWVHNQGSVCGGGAGSGAVAATKSTFLTPAQFNSLPRSGTIDPSRIRFSQDSISPTFGDGRTVADLTAQLRAGRSAGAVPPIRIVHRNGKVYTLDNRRLKAFRDAGVPVPYQRLEHVPADELFKFTTTNDGVDIIVRGG
jgi:RHS repeat-associated protein